MSYNLRGSVTPLKFGTTTISGYIVEETGFDKEAENIEISDEDLEIVIDISAVEEKHSGRVSVIPLSAATPPAVGDIFSYTSGTTARDIVVDAVREKSVKKNVTMWDIEGHAHPAIDISTP